MLSPSHKINEILRDYQAVSLLGNAAEFSRALIKLIFRYALEARSQMKQERIPARHSVRIYNYLNNLDGDSLVGAFRIWWQNVPLQDHKRIHSKSSLEAHFEPIELFLKWFPSGVSEVFLLFDSYCDKVMGGGEPNFRESPILLDVLIGGFLEDPSFLKYLDGDEGETPCLSLRGMFNVILFSCDKSTKKIHMVRPGVGHVESRREEYSVFKRYLPHLKEDEFRESGSLYDLLEKEWDIHASFDRIRHEDRSEIGLRTGWTTLTYRTTWDQNRERELDFFLGNLNSAQLRPVPSQPLLGFFQLQSPVEGLIRILFPVEEFPEKSRVRIEGEIQELSAIEPGRTCDIQMAELPADWYDEVGEDDDRLAFVKGFKFLGHPDWPAILYDGFGHLNEMVISLRNQVEPLMVDASLRGFAKTIMHEVNNDLNRLKVMLPLDEIRRVRDEFVALDPSEKRNGLHDQLLDLDASTSNMKKLLEITHYKTAGYYSFASNERAKGVDVVDRSLLELVQAAWCDYLVYPLLEIEFVEESAWGLIFRGYQGDFEFALSIAMRNAARHRRGGSVVQCEARINEVGELVLSWTNATTSDCVERLAAKREAEDVNQSSSGLDYSVVAIRKSFEAELTCEASVEGLDHPYVRTQLKVAHNCGLGNIFYIHPDCRLRLRK